jgi:hypothetical protein
MKDSKVKTSWTLKPWTKSERTKTKSSLKPSTQPLETKKRKRSSLTLTYSTLQLVSISVSSYVISMGKMSLLKKLGSSLQTRTRMSSSRSSMPEANLSKSLIALRWPSACKWRSKKPQMDRSTSTSLQSRMRLILRSHRVDHSRSEVTMKFRLFRLKCQHRRYKSKICSLKEPQIWARK